MSTKFQIGEKIVIERIFDAPRELVWRAWTEPELVKEWWGPEGFTAPSIKIDLRVGGKYIYAMKGPEGSEWDKVMYTAGVYQEIVPQEKLVATDYFSDKDGNRLDPADFGMDPHFPKEPTITYLFEDVEGNKTKVSAIYPKPENQQQLEAIKKSGMVDGWQSSLNKLDAVLGRM